MRKRILQSVLLVTLLVCLCGPAIADVPQNMNVQGQLTDSSDAPRVGTFFFTFKIFDAEVGGTEIWPNAVGENHSITTDAQGTWDASLGSIIALSESVFGDTTRWLEIQVTDGVDPTEILPRVKLGTGPYTYRAASSQQADDADLLNGQSASDFVSTDGDVMTGDLDFDFTGLRLRLDASASEYLGYRSTGVLNMTLGGASASSYLKLYGNDILRFNLIGGSSFAQQQMFNTAGNLTIDLRANSGTGGELRLQQEDATPGLILRGGSTTNGSTLQMYSAAGSNTITFDADIVGNAAAILPNNSIFDGEILDEPGIAESRNGGSIELTTNLSSMTTITSRAITIPTAGYIHATSRCWISSTGTTGNVFLQINDSPGGATEIGLYSLIGTRDGAATAYYDGTSARTWLKQAGTHTFYFAGAENSNSSANAGYAVLTLMFFPTSYGTVSALVSENELNEYNAVNVLPAGVMPGMDGTVSHGPVYEVDLRDFEIKAARAEAAAANAARELAEARALSAESEQNTSTGATTQGDQ